MLFNIIIISVGLISSLLLFYRFPMLKENTNIDGTYKLSIIIPARNEEVNISLLLQDLKEQTYPIHEIICVDDCSFDNTAKVAAMYDINLIRILDKPEDWTGKAWACEKGSEAATGEILLFLDADVRLSVNGIASLIKTYDENKCVISVQPYHHTLKSYEQFSLFFNLIQVAANGTTMVLKGHNAGLYGPVILISKEEYMAIEGHKSVRNSIVDDIALGEKLNKKGFSYKLYLGGKYISFRMYREGISELIHGWTKNYATGASKTPKLLFLMVFLWVTSCASITLNFLQGIITKNIQELLIYFLLYILWIFELSRISYKIGNYKKYTIISFPIFLGMFLWVFILSFLKKLFHGEVIWKSRKIRLEK